MTMIALLLAKRICTKAGRSRVVRERRLCVGEI
jgi:hypothetical protein